MSRTQALLALCVALGLATPAHAWKSGHHRYTDREGWRQVGADQTNDHGFLAAQSILSLAGRASYSEATTYANDIELGVWFEDQIGMPDQGVFPTPIDYFTMRLMQTNHFPIPSQSTIVLRTLYWHLTQDPIMRNRGVYGSRCVTILGPNAYTWVVSGALVRARILYATALLAAQAGDMRTAWWLVGRATHYEQDLAHPFHDVSADAFNHAMSVYNGLMCFHLGWNPFTTANCHWMIEEAIANRTMQPARAGFLVLDPANAGDEAARQSLYRGGTTWQGVQDRAAAWHHDTSSTSRWQACYDLAEGSLFPWAIQDGASLFDAFYRSYRP